MPDDFDIVFSGLGCVGDGYDAERIAALARLRSRTEAMEETLFQWQAVSTPHAYHCRPFSEAGCTCGLKEARAMTRATLASAANPGAET